MEEDILSFVVTFFSTALGPQADGKAANELELPPDFVALLEDGKIKVLWKWARSQIARFRACGSPQFHGLNSSGGPGGVMVVPLLLSVCITCRHPGTGCRKKDLDFSFNAFKTSFPKGIVSASEFFLPRMATICSTLGIDFFLKEAIRDIGTQQRMVQFLFQNGHKGNFLLMLVLAVHGDLPKDGQFSVHLVTWKLKPSRLQRSPQALRLRTKHTSTQSVMTILQFRQPFSSHLLSLQMNPRSSHYNN